MNKKLSNISIAGARIALYLSSAALTQDSKSATFAVLLAPARSARS